MLDIKLIRKDPAKIEELLKRKDPSISLKLILSLDEQIRDVIVEVENLQSKRNAFSKDIGEKKRKGEDASIVMQEMAGLGDQVSRLNHEKGEIEKQLQHALALLPNLPFEEIKVSHDPKENVCLRSWGEKREFDFQFKNHVELNEKLHLFDFKRAAKTSGSGWPAYRNMG
ncbi:MAG: serine--tRNA ligase, partial [Rhabdochlamydiaceae bacterium]